MTVTAVRDAVTEAVPRGDPPGVLPVVLAGGAGTRLWPLSRSRYPKQLLRLHRENTLLQETVTRLDGLNGADSAAVNVAAPLVICNEEHRFLMLEQLEGIGRGSSRIVLESVSRNTAPALTLAAFLATADGADPILVVMPADHVIGDLDVFHRAVVSAIELARGGAIVTFGIVPDRPQTGYGYIRKGGRLDVDGGDSGFVIDAFVEKPDLISAKSYVESGEYLWNSGLFLMSASVWLDAIARFRGEVHAACREAIASGRADGAFFWVGRDEFAGCPSDSIDYAVMERLAGAAADGVSTLPRPAVVPLDAGWSDIGAWPALLDLADVDVEANVIQGDVYLHRSKKSLFIAEHRLVAGVGVEDLIVVETADAVLVAHKDHCQDVGKVVEWLKAEGREEGSSHRRVYRPWGSFEQLDAGSRFQVKRLTVKPGASLSLQMHHHRAEHWVVVHGTAKVSRDGEEFLLTENQSTYIPVGVRHRLENPGRLPLEIIEVQSGSYLGEDDIRRFDDRYARGEDA